MLGTTLDVVGHGPRHPPRPTAGRNFRGLLVADPVRDAVAPAPGGHGKFELVTDFVAWRHVMVRNRLNSSARQRRSQTGPCATAGEAMDGAGPQRDDRSVVKALARMSRRLPDANREAPLLAPARGGRAASAPVASGNARASASSRAVAS